MMFTASLSLLHDCGQSISWAEALEIFSYSNHLVEESKSVESIRLPCFNYYYYHCPVSIVRTSRIAADTFISQEQLHKMLFIILPAVQIYLFVLLVQLTMFLSLLYKWILHTSILNLLILINNYWLVGWLLKLIRLVGGYFLSPRVVAVEAYVESLMPNLPLQHSHHRAELD